MTQVQCSASYQQIKLDECINHVREEFSPASLIAKKSMFAHRGWGFFCNIKACSNISYCLGLLSPGCWIWNEETWLTNLI